MSVPSHLCVVFETLNTKEKNEQKESMCVKGCYILKIEAINYTWNLLRDL